MTNHEYLGGKRAIDEEYITAMNRAEAKLLSIVLPAILALMFILTLSACGTTKVIPVAPTPVQMPALPASLNQRAQDLPPVVATDLHGMIRESVQTDRAYNDLRDRHNSVLDAWTCVAGALNKGADALECFRGSQ